MGKVTHRCQILAAFMTVSAGFLASFSVNLWIGSSEFFPMSSIASVCLSLVSLFFGLVAWDVSSHEPADSHSIKTLLLQYLFTRLILYMGKKFHSELLEKAERIKETQKELLKDIVRTNADTRFGAEHSFNNIEDLGDFRREVSLVHYEEMNKYVQAIEGGEFNVLTKDKVLYFATTSGTTGKNKLLPITYYLKHKMGKRIGALMFKVMYDYAKLGLGRILKIAYKAQVRVSKKSGLTIGPVTHHMARDMPFLLSPKEASDLNNEKQALYAHAVFGLRDPEVEMLEGMMSGLTYSFWKLIENNWRELCKDIEKGKISIKGLDETTKIYLEKQLRPCPQRADDLRREFEKGFHGIARRIWPRLKVVRMLTSGAFEIHAKVLHTSYMAGVPQLSNIHAASEGVMGVNLNPELPNVEYTFIPHFGFLEFIPEEKCAEEQPETLTLDQLKIGEKYEIVLTTPMGLYRYRTGDVVQITGFTNQCPRYTYLYRLGQALNLFWEKTSEGVLCDAVSRTVAKLSADGPVLLIDFTATENVNVNNACPQEEKNKSKHYVLFIELEADSQDFILSDDQKKKFDDNLCTIFELYNTLRQNDSIGRMDVNQVPKGTFMALKYRMIAETMNQQFKMPRVIRNPDLIRQLLESRFEDTACIAAEQ